MSKQYKDIEDYGIIGNLQTCALIGKDGSIDWLCFPFLESPSVFAALLDIDRGGQFQITPLAKYQSMQSYSKNTNVLETTFFTSLGVAVITDFMEVEGRKEKDDARILFRRVECIKGEVKLGVNFAPRFDYARVFPEFALKREGVIAQGKDKKLFLQSPTPLEINNKAAEGILTISKEEGSVWFILQYDQMTFFSNDECEKILHEVKQYWLGWSERSVCSLVGQDESWHALIVRSGLVLQLLVIPEIGSVAAAATTSLPEVVGGTRNWDYRYAWIRDASFTVQALFHLGHIKESKNFRRWIWEIIGRYNDPSQIRIMYDLRKKIDSNEQILGNLSGYKDSSPVRVGNAAAAQKQLDIYGELLNMVYETTRYGKHVPYKRWPEIKRIVNYVCEVWNTEDSGIWEVRGRLRHFVYSKLMCWVAIDRGIKISKAKGFKASLESWEEQKNGIRREILEKGFSKGLNSFVQCFGSEVLDATSLLIPMMGFLPFDDKRVQGTIDATLKRLTTPDGLVYRYQTEDGLPGTEGNFILCSFWLVEVLALSGRVKEAEEIFSKILNYVSPLGLLSEEIDPETHKQIGNFPQAFSHIGLINSALYLDIAKGREHKGPRPIGIS
ncbi:MAG: glycoside hydrolase family 15 protein [Candidatus Omnitrophica bacterium]|nr:glycoside hydrolase family 15 protein [Candidatus Omnitrophota bacterium]